MKNLQEYRGMAAEELQQEVLNLREMQFKMRLQKANGELEKNHQVKAVRRAIAQVKTILVEKAENNG